MQITVLLEASETLKTLLTNLTLSLSQRVSKTVDADDVPKEPKKTSKKASKKSKPAEDVADDLEVSVDDDTPPDGEDFDSFDDDESEDDGKLTDSDPAKLKKVRDALSSYAMKHGGDNAKKVLRKFAPVSTKVKLSDVPALLKALGSK